MSGWGTIALLVLVGCGRLGFEAISDDAAAEDAAGELPLCAGVAAEQLPYASGSGTSRDPYVLCSAPQLQSLSERPQDWSSRFVMGAHIDAASLSSFRPIGGAEEPFLGSFDGRGHAISRLELSGGSIDGQPGSYRGLFGRLGRGAEVVDVELRHFKPNPEARRHVGAIAGAIDAGARVARVSLRGAPLSIESGLIRRVGGLVGGNFGTLEDCFVRSDVQVVAAAADPEDRTSVGGVVGANAGVVRRCYFAGDLTSNAARVGGVVGRNRIFVAELSDFDPGDLSGSFSTGAVSGDSPQCHHIGPVVGGAVVSEVDELYYDASADCVNADAGCASCDFADAQIAIDLTAQTGYFFDPANPPLSGWDFEVVWEISAEDGWPRLRH